MGWDTSRIRWHYGYSRGRGCSAGLAVDLKIGLRADTGNPANTACIFVVECEGDGELVFAAKKMVRAMKTAELGGLQILTSPPYNDCIQQTILGH